jgi:hypothetical protein
MAVLQGGDPAAAARAAAPGWSRERLAVRFAGRAVRVTVQPRTVLPGLAALLTARATADAGPADAGLASSGRGPSLRDHRGGVG